MTNAELISRFRDICEWCERYDNEISALGKLAIHTIAAEAEVALQNEMSTGESL